MLMLMSYQQALSGRSQELLPRLSCIALGRVGGLTPHSACACVRWQGGDADNADRNQSLFIWPDSGYKARQAEDTHLVKGDRPSKNAINNFKISFQGPARQIGAHRVYPRRSQGLSKHVVLDSKSTCVSVRPWRGASAAFLWPHGGAGAGKSPDWEAEGDFGVRMVHK